MPDLPHDAHDRLGLGVAARLFYPILVTPNQRAQLPRAPHSAQPAERWPVRRPRAVREQLADDLRGRERPSSSNGLLGQGLGESAPFSSRCHSDPTFSIAARSSAGSCSAIRSTSCRADRPAPRDPGWAPLTPRSGDAGRFRAQV
ncbi:hypothetical protein HBB16_19405 [Pseudonocardia sp. MCCB 268]|nr:hypothetical protein [Pseudonocardia cytotoxica]